MDTIELSELESLTRGTAGLIIGPSQTTHPGAINELRDALATRFGGEARGSYLDAGESAAIAGASEEQLRQAIAEFVGLWKPSPSLRAIAAGRWASVFSASLDLHFENLLQQEADRHPSRRAINIVSNFTLPLPPRTVSVFKLLGVHTRTDFPCTIATHLNHRTTWRRVTAEFAASVKGNPVLCLGMAELDWLLIELLTELLADRHSTPSSLVFLADDPLVNNHRLAALSRGRVALSSVRSGMSSLLKILDTAASKSLTLPLIFHDDESLFSSLSRFDDIVTPVNNYLKPSTKAEERLLLSDILFSPTTTRWDPYFFNLDFQRSDTKHVTDDIKSLQAEFQVGDIAYTLLGSAASGKTTILKRLAFDFAAQGALVLWQRASYLPDPTRQLKSLFQEVARLSREATSGHIFYFIDDPLSSGTIRPDQVLRAARESNVPIVLVATARTSDWMISGISDELNGFSATRTATLGDSLDESEWNALPEYLVRIGVYQTIDVARSKCDSSPGKSTKDTLSLLYWLLPQTRGSITNSVRDQYFRLGDFAGLRRVVLGATDHSPQLLQDAYAMAAVADFYQTPLSLEVLVSALNVDFGTWRETIKDDGPLWGILYAEESSSGTVMFKPRNSLVTEMLIETMNGGTIGHTGEFRHLARLVEGGRGKSAPLYRDFFIRLLVSGDAKNRLDFDEGLRLFDLAIECLPFPDKTLVHHKGLWLKNKGNDPVLANQVLQQALQTPVFPYTDKGESSQFIHTSLAANALDAIDQGTLSLQEGRHVVVNHLAQARTSDLSDAKAVHVHANLAIRLVEKLENAPADTFAVASKVLADIDQSLLLLQNPVSPSADPRSETAPLETVRDKLLRSMTHKSGDATLDADSAWEAYQSQDGFVVAARKLLEVARSSGKGAAFKKSYEYCVRSRGQVEAAGVPVSPQLSQVQLEIYWRWQVLRLIASPLGNGADWEIVKSLATEAISGEERSRITMSRFMLGVAYAHLGEWERAFVQFGQLRQLNLPSQVMWRPRAVLLNSDGGPRRVQGTVKQGSGGRKFLHIEDLQTDVHCDRRNNWPRDGEKTHAYIEFAFQGPTATMDLS